jgi:transposase
MQSVVGIDVSKSKLDICLIIKEKKEKTAFKVCKNNKKGFQDLLKWIDSKCEKTEKPRIFMEATGAYMEELAEFFNGNGFEVSVVNPLLIKRSAKVKMHQGKTDKADAQQIAKYCLDNNPRLWKPRPAEYRELRDVCRAIKFLKEKLTAVSNRGNETRIINEKAQEAMDIIVLSIEKQIDELELEARRIVKSHETLLQQFNKLTKIKGVGFWSACRTLSEMPNVENFDNAKQYSAFAGVTPLPFESGSSVRKRSKISKMGPNELRHTIHGFSHCEKPQ